MRKLPKEAIRGHKSTTKLWPCDNCCGRHWGYYEQCGSWDAIEWDFIWTAPDGTPKWTTWVPCIQ